MEKKNPRGRPPLSDEFKSVTVSIRLSKDEVEKLDEYGKISGLSRSQIIQKLVNAIIVVKPRGD